MEPISINHLAVFLCALFNLILGAIWYSPALFYNVWKKENNLRDEDFKEVNMMKMYAISFTLSLIISYNMAFFLAGEETDWIWGTSAGFLTGFGWCAMIFIIIGLFELKSLKYILVNSGYIIVYFTVIGFILGVWK